MLLDHSVEWVALFMSINGDRFSIPRFDLRGL